MHRKGLTVRGTAHAAAAARAKGCRACRRRRISHLPPSRGHPRKKRGGNGRFSYFNWLLIRRFADNESKLLAFPFAFPFPIRFSFILRAVSRGRSATTRKHDLLVELAAPVFEQRIGGRGALDQRAPSPASSRPYHRHMYDAARKSPFAMPLPRFRHSKKPISSLCIRWLNR